MSEYKHGDWYCVPANDAEGVEIIDRAMSSGALNPSDATGLIQNAAGMPLCIFGVVDGKIVIAGEHRRRMKKYTISELRKMFPLPGESVEPTQWRGPEDGLPPVGVVCEIEWVKNQWIAVVILLVTEKSIVLRRLLDSSERLIGIYAKLNFRPLRTEREKFVEACLGVVPHNTSEADYLYMAADKIYDAIKSGQIKAPEAE